MPLTDKPTCERIRDLNDTFRKTVDPTLGSFELAGQKLFWKIDYYDPKLEFGSDDPADPSKTTRVLTLMLAMEY